MNLQNNESIYFEMVINAELAGIASYIYIQIYHILSSKFGILVPDYD